MGEAKRKQTLLERAAGLIGFPAAFEDEDEAVEPLTTAEGPLDPLWMLGTPSYRRKTAFVESIGTRFGGHLFGTAVFVLDRWSEAPHGLRWVLQPTPARPEDFSTQPHALALMAACLVNTRVGLQHLAIHECQGDLVRAIQRAMNEQMDLFGLDLYLPEVPA